MRIGIVGSGNVATHLGRALVNAGHQVVAVCSRTEQNAARLAHQLGARAITDPADMPADICDVVLIAVSDRAVASVSQTLPVSAAIVAHTSGSIPLETLAARHSRAGVFYPLQTFSRQADVDFSTIPLFIEGTDDAVSHELTALASRLSHSVHYADSEVRSRLHIAGVLSSNFPIYLLEMTREVLGDIPLNVVEPLAFASLQKAFAMGPADALTGPARRGDVAVVKRQAEALPEGLSRRIYLDISQAILNKYYTDIKL